MKTPIIGVVGRIDIAEPDYKVICIPDSIRRSIVKRDAIVLPLLPNQPVKYHDLRYREVPALTKDEQNKIIKLIDMCDGIIIPGGNRWFEFDEFVAKYAISQNMPILGICVGMQILGVLDNNKETVIIPNETKLDHNIVDEKPVHDILIKDNTLLKRIIGEDKILINSKHKYNLSKVNNYIVSAYSEDGLIEAIEDPTKDFVVGVQWHPESMDDYDSNASKFLDYFMNYIKDNIRIKSITIIDKNDNKQF